MIKYLNRLVTKAFGKNRCRAYFIPSKQPSFAGDARALHIDKD